MWTPKRILILLGGLALFMTGYLVYAYFLGGIDGLPILMADYLPSKIPGDSYPILLPENESDTATKLKRAFGPDCLELKRAIKLNLPSKRVLLAAEQFDIEKSDGRVKLSPFSAAIFGKERGNGLVPEINTIQCACAYLTMDQKVANLTDLSNRKIVRVELIGNPNILMINNNRTLEQSDDIEVNITEGPMFYDEPKNLIWTEGIVQLKDNKSAPPTNIIGRGMELKLAEGTGPNRPKTSTTGPKNKDDKAGSTEKVTGLEMVILKNNVNMYLYLDANSSFLAPSTDPTKEKQVPAKGELPEKSEVTIKTSGPFHYDLLKELAWFDSPPPGGANLPSSFDQVEVIRKHKDMKFDHLLCNHLELHFRKKGDSDPKKLGDSRTSDNEIDSALATARASELVTITMDIENLEAEGSELHYRSPNATTGPQTILKGSPMRAVKDAHKIEANELHLIGADTKGFGQQAFAKGPGKIDIYDKSNPKNEYPSHALWKDTLTIVKEHDGDKVRDLITLTGNASFRDDEHNTMMAGQRLQVWLDSGPQGSEAGKTRELNATSVAKQQIHKIEAFEKVSARSPELIVHYANHLVIRFKDEPAVGGRLPDFLPSSPTAPAPAPPEAIKTSGPKPNLTQAPPKAPVTKPLAQNPSDSKKPIELTANDVDALVATQGEAKVLQDLVTVGAVHVFQEGELSQDKKTKEKGLDIKGHLLHLVHDPRGDILYVFGDSNKAAQLQLGELTIIGPKVTINQIENSAAVAGAGAMSLPSDKSLDGGKAANGKTRLTIHWDKDMFFDGKAAEFHGNVQADQDSAKMKCETLYVTLDRVVSFKEGQKENQKPSVERLVCDRKVRVEEVKRDAAGKLLQFDRLVAFQLSTNNKEGPTIATGPAGKVEHLSASAADDPLGAPPQRPKDKGPKNVEVMKLTRILFDGQMHSNNTDNSRTTYFYNNVEVFHFPSESPDTKMNADSPPKDGFYMSCNNLKVYTRLIDNKSSQMMQAERNVFFRTKDFYGRAAVVKYNESQEQVIFEGVPGSPATLYRLIAGSSQPQEIKGSQIIYNRKTGEFQLVGGNNITVPGN